MIKDTTNMNMEYLDSIPVEDGELNEQGILNVALSFFDKVRCLYVKTNDTAIVTGKQYYTYSNGIYTPVQNPAVEHISDYYEKSTEKEVLLFKNYLPIAKMFCCRLYDWSFLIKSVTYEEDDIVNEEDYTDPAEAESGTFLEPYTDTDGTRKYHGYKMYKNFKYAFNIPDGFIKAKYVNGIQNNGFAVKGNTFYCNSKSPTLDYASSDCDENVPVDFGYMIAYRVAIDMANMLDNSGEISQKASSMFSISSQSLQANDSFNFRLQNHTDNYFTDSNSPYWVSRGVTVPHGTKHFK